MIPIVKGLLALALVTAPVAGAVAQEFTKGVIKKVDLKSKKVTIRHEELKGLDMPAMTMVFRTADEAMLGRMKEGAAIEFVVERVNGKLTITQMK